ncbi:hypothetical protein SAMN06265220_1011366 [Flavobacterium nitrogenifigens]|uniref:Uncharacterized protein n=1 Tax=Flavobacterium nitrogenifigens TaxID=1617283 RepID=A0A521BUN0_9FLAO|nr:hypothetical protein SAMN06265220_1011366 [Flavobacterium nitrogenifigens]
MPKAKEVSSKKLYFHFLPDKIKKNKINFIKV